MTPDLIPGAVNPAPQFSPAYEWDAVSEQRRPVGAGIKRDVEPDAVVRTDASAIADDVRPADWLSLNVTRKPCKASAHNMTSRHRQDVKANPDAYRPELVRLLTEPAIKRAAVPAAPAVVLTEAEKRARERAERKRYLEQKEAREYVVTPADVELVLPHLLAGRKEETIQRAVKLPRLVTRKILRAARATIQ